MKALKSNSIDSFQEREHTYLTEHLRVKYLNNRYFLSSMDKNNALVVFQNKKIRRIRITKKNYFTVKFIFLFVSE